MSSETDPEQPELEEAAESDRPRSRWARSGAIVGILLLAGVVFVSANLGDGQKFAELIREAEPFWLLAALIYQAATYLCAAGVWEIALRRFHIKIPVGSLASLSMAKLSIDKIIPTGGIGGGVLLVRGLMTRGAPGPVATGALLLDLLSIYTARAISVGISIGVLWMNYGLQAAVVTLAAVYATATVFVTIGILWLTRPGERKIPGWTNKIPGLTKVIENLVNAPPEIMRNRSLFLKAVALQFMIIVLDAATLDAMLRAIGQPSLPHFVFASFALAAAASTLTLIPGGLGAFEAVSILMLRLLRIPIEAGLAATLMLRAYTLWLPMIPGFFILRRESRRAVKRPAEDKIREGR